MDWADMNHDLLFLIAKKVTLYEDFVSFAGVCTSWRGAAATWKTFNRTSPQIPWLMLPEKKDNPDFRDFYSVGKDKIVRKNQYLPEAKGKVVCLESKGWLFTQGEDGDMNLLHPFSRQQIHLPRYNGANADFATSFYLPKTAALSASPSDTSDYVLMIIYRGWGQLRCWRPGDTSWTPIDIWTWDCGCSDNITYYEGYFYAIDSFVCVAKCDGRGPNPSVARIPLHERSFMHTRVYIVESSSPNKLFVIRQNDNGYKAFEVDLIEKRWVPVESLGDRAIFVGHGAAISLKACSFPGIIKENHIYFACDNSFTCIGGGRDNKGMGMYNMEDGSFKPLFKGLSISLTDPPIWVTPSFY